MNFFKNMSLPRLAIERPVTVAMVLLSCFALGIIAVYKLPLEFLMRVDVPLLSCYIPYPGAFPEQVESEVAKPAEEEFMTLPHLQRISSWSDGNGCSLLLRYNWDTNMSMAAADLRDTIERLKLKLPADVERIFIRRFSSDTAPVLRFALFRDDRQDELAQWARTILKNRLLRINGVADVEVSGRETREVYVEFNQGALQSRGLGLYDVVQSLQQNNVSIGAGQLDEGSHTYFVRIVDELHEPEELAAAVITKDGVRLDQVANVHVLPPEGADQFMVDGKRGVFINVLRESEANTVAVCDAIHEELARLRNGPDLEGTDTFVFEDQAEIIRYALGQLFKAGELGSLLALAVLWLFLRNMRATLLVSLTTPASLVVAFVFLYFTGHSLNIITIASMLLAVGMLVDNAIVVIENIHQYYEREPGAADIPRRGAEQVGLAITASTLTTIVVFIPVFYLNAGELSLIMKEFAGPMATALLASLVLALTLLPLVESKMGAKLHTAAAPKAPSGWRRHTKRWFGWFQPFMWFQAYYAEALRTTLSRRPTALGMLALCALITYAVPFREVGLQQMPTLDLRQVRVFFSADPNYGSDAVTKTVDQLTAALDLRREELGIANVYVRTWTSGGEIRVYLVKEDELPRGAEFPYSTEEVRDSLSILLPRTVPGATLDCGVAQTDVNEERRVAVRVRGDNSAKVREYAELFRKQLDKADPPLLNDTKVELPDDKEEIQVSVDMERAATAGASPLFIARTVDFALRGVRLPPLKKMGDETSVWAKFREEDRRDAEDLMNIAVPALTKSLVPLNRLATLTRQPTPPTLYREDGKNVTTVSGGTRDKNLSRVQAGIEQVADQFALDQGYTIAIGQRLEELNENIANFRSALIMAVILIYIVMAALFESFILPLSILTAVPLAFIGVYWSMYLTDTPLDTVALVGSILMCGVIVNNGIVIIDLINELRRDGMDRFNAVIRAGKNRLRPVLMTTLTTVLGTLPIAFTTSGESSALTSLGRTFVGGLTAGTVLTLVVVPLFYTLIDDLREWMMAFAGSFRRSASQGTTTAVRENL